MQTLNQIADAAKSTFDLPIKRRLPKRDVIQDKFERFHAAHPEVYRLLVRLTYEAKARGYHHYSIKAIYEQARFHRNLANGGRRYKLSNSYHALYARLIMEQEEDLKGFFEIRRRNYDRQKRGKADE